LYNVDLKAVSPYRAANRDSLDVGVEAADWVVDEELVRCLAFIDEELIECVLLSEAFIVMQYDATTTTTTAQKYIYINAKFQKQDHYYYQPSGIVQADI
jgi:hypothetical protein